MTPPNPLTELAERVGRLTGPCRETDLAIHLALYPDSDLAKITKNPRGLEGQEGYSWDIKGGSVVFERWDGNNHCPFNGGYPLPAYTASLDAAMTLVPEGWDYCLSVGIDEPAQAGMSPAGGVAEVEADALTPALALTAASLRARAASENSHG